MTLGAKDSKKNFHLLMTAWALVNGDKVVEFNSTALKVFATKREAALHRFIGGDRLIRVRIEEIPSKCRSGCAMVDDVPVFCRKHAPKDASVSREGR